MTWRAQLYRSTWTGHRLISSFYPILPYQAPPFKFLFICLLGFPHLNTSNICKDTDKSNFGGERCFAVFLIFPPISILRNQARRFFHASCVWGNPWRASIWDMLGVYTYQYFQSYYHAAVPICSLGHSILKTYLLIMVSENRKKSYFSGCPNKETKNILFKRARDALWNGVSHGRIGRQKSISLIGVSPSHPKY